MSEIFPESPLTSVPDAVAFMGALPVPAGPTPRTLDVVEDELAGVSLSLYEEELLTERLRWALASAKRGRSRLRAQVADSEQRSERRRIAWRMAYQRARGRGWAADRAGERVRQGQTAMQDMLESLLAMQIERDAALARVAELEEERRSTNEALDDAVQALRARQSCPCPPADQPGPHQVGCPQAEVPSPLFPTVASLCEVVDGEHYAYVHRSYLKGHDLDVPGTGGAQ